MSVSLAPAPILSRATILDAVKAAFEAVLGVENPGDDDDFFELGGDSLMALSLFLQIEEATGQTLPMTVIYDAPTVAKLTDRLQGGGGGGRATCLVELRPAKSRNAGPPLFLLHGMGGSVMILRDLARRIGGTRAVWGIEAQGMDGLLPPLDRVEAMAEAHIEDLRAIAPHGPYLFAGYSFGGLVAFEMARQLVQAGEEVALLALLDTFPHPGTWRFSSRARALWLQAGVYASPKVWAGLAKRHFDKLQSRSPLAAAAHLARGIARAVTLPLDIMRTAWVHDFAGRATVHKDMLTALDAPAMAATAYETIDRVTTSARHAFKAYVPKPYPGTLVVFRATGQQAIPFEPKAIWGHLVRDLVVREAPTDHQTLVRADAAATAAQLTAAIDQALAGRAK
jgi:thioesterase domain-containing protein/acyl carrier protein